MIVQSVAEFVKKDDLYEQNQRKNIATAQEFRNVAGNACEYDRRDKSIGVEMGE